jgi:hypothetical protein
MKLPLSGAQPATLVSPDTPFSMTVDATSLYWIETHGAAPSGSTSVMMLNPK